MLSIKRTNRTLRFSLGVLLLAPGCAFFGDGGGGSGNETDASSLLNAAILLPEDGFYIEEEDIEIDETIDIAPSDSGSVDVVGGDVLSPSVTFSAPEGNVVGFGVRFGDTGPIAVTPVPDAVGNTTGTVAGTMTIPPGICEDLSEICHSIKCFEFAVTSAGKISRANITDLALACNNCDEPSCAELLESCDIDDEPLDGEGTVTSRNVTITVIDSNAVQDDFYDIFVNGTKVGEAHNAPGASSTATATLRSGTNLIELRLVEEKGQNTQLTLLVEPGPFSQEFTGTRDHSFSIVAP